MNPGARMDIFSICALLLMAGCAPQQSAPEKFDAEKYLPSYSLVVPQGWGVERFGIPIEFAPSIPYRGVEDLRFAPGWSDAQSKEYWSYAFLWYLQGKPEITPEITETNLTAYYTGLVGRNIEKRKIPAEKLMPVKVKLISTSVVEEDLQTYSGTIDMLDYMEQKPITLNCIVHVKLCTSEADRTFLFFEISPQVLTDNVWEDLHKLWATFECSTMKH